MLAFSFHLTHPADLVVVPGGDRLKEREAKREATEGQSVELRLPGPTSRMSRRRSTGDLVPRDITEILAREARAQRGQKKSGNSLGQAFSWLKGSRRKKSIGNGQSRTGGSNAKLGLQNQEPAKGNWILTRVIIVTTY